MRKGSMHNKSWSVIKCTCREHSTKRFALIRFRLGDQVLAVRRLIIMTHMTGSMFTPKWDGPYVIRDVYSNVAYKMVDIEEMRVDR